MYCFQTDSEIVKNQFNVNNNYLIECDSRVSSDYCIVYFSSNDIYYPNDEQVFQQSIIDKDRYEWYGSRIACGHKHIFIRDIQKQWYLGGINKDIDSPQKLVEFLKRETEGYKLVFVGSSSGGFASIIYGQLLNAELILSFNGQFEIHSLLKQSTKQVDPLVFRLRDKVDILPFYDAKLFIKNTASIFYFLSVDSSWDAAQYEYVRDTLPSVIKFKSHIHGIPFLKSSIKPVINLKVKDLNKLKGGLFHPIIFSLKIAGLKMTLIDVTSLLNYEFSKIFYGLYSRYFQRYKKRLFG